MVLGVPNPAEATFICAGGLLMACFLIIYTFVEKTWRIPFRYWYFYRYGKGQYIVYTGEEMKMASCNFAEPRILWKSKLATVYDGMLTCGKVVAIKAVNSRVRHTFLYDEVALSELDHPHIVSLLGFCLDTKKPILVYEYNDERLQEMLDARYEEDHFHDE